MRSRGSVFSETTEIRVVHEESARFSVGGGGKLASIRARSIRNDSQDQEENALAIPNMLRLL